jgi:hypothetical protein
MGLYSGLYGFIQRVEWVYVGLYASYLVVLGAVELGQHGLVLGQPAVHQHDAVHGRLRAEREKSSREQQREKRSRGKEQKSGEERSGVGWGREDKREDKIR